MITPALLVVLGFACLIFGGNWLVDGASALAKRNNISDLVIGLTIVSFGTSAPELVVNLMASFDGHSDIVFGNIRSEERRVGKECSDSVLRCPLRGGECG